MMEPAGDAFKALLRRPGADLTDRERGFFATAFRQLPAPKQQDLLQQCGDEAGGYVRGVLEATFPQGRWCCVLLAAFCEALTSSVRSMGATAASLGACAVLVSGLARCLRAGSWRAACGMESWQRAMC